MSTTGNMAIVPDAASLAQNGPSEVTNENRNVGTVAAFMVARRPSLPAALAARFRPIGSACLFLKGPWEGAVGPPRR
jgi:hypothetical protein